MGVPPSAKPDALVVQLVFCCPFVSNVFDDGQQCFSHGADFHSRNTPDAYLVEVLAKRHQHLLRCASLLRQQHVHVFAVACKLMSFDKTLQFHSFDGRERGGFHHSGHRAELLLREAIFGQNKRRNAHCSNETP